MGAQTKPATQLPWEHDATVGSTSDWIAGSNPDAPSIAHITRTGREKGSKLSTVTHENAQDAAYIVHAANAYPRLIEALRQHAYPETERGQAAIALLRELGEAA